jgi:hypothetical protein
MGDPFSEEPLSYDKDDFESLLIETSSVQRADQICADLLKTQPKAHRVYIVGERGMGKSTVMNFAAWKLIQATSRRPILPVYISTLPSSKVLDELKTNFLKTVISHLFSAVLRDTRLLNQNPQLEAFFREKRTIFFDKIHQLDALVAQEFLRECLSRLNSSGIETVAVLFDELDRFDNQPLFLDFLKRSQGLFETLARDNVVFFLTGVPDWIRLLKGDEYSGMRGETIELAAWTADDSFKLTSTRFKRFCTAAMRFPITEEATRIVTKQATGRPRLILSLTRTLLSLAASQRVSIIDDEFCKGYLWPEESLDTLRLELAKNDSALRGARKLRKAIDPEKDDPRKFKILALVSNLGKIQDDLPLSEIRRGYGMDIESRTFWNMISILENTKLIKKLQLPHRKDNYELDSDLKALFLVVNRMGEPVEFLPYAISMLQGEVKIQEERFDADLEITKLLSASPSKFFDVDEITSSLLESHAILDSARRLAAQRGQEEENLYSFIRKLVSQSLDRLKRKGLLQAKDKNGTSVYGWLPKHLDWRQFEGLDIDTHVIADLEAGEMNFKSGLYDSAGQLTRGVVERSLRRLYEVSQSRKCHDDWAIEQLNAELFRLKIYDRRIQSRVLALQQLSNPIVHGEVVGIGERNSRILLDMAQEIVKEVYAKINEFLRTPPRVSQADAVPITEEVTTSEVEGAVLASAASTLPATPKESTQEKEPENAIPVAPSYPAQQTEPEKEQSA